MAQCQPRLLYRLLCLGHPKPSFPSKAESLRREKETLNSDLEVGEMTALPQFGVQILKANTRRGSASWQRGTCRFDSEHLIPERASYPLRFHPLLGKSLKGPLISLLGDEAS